MKKREYLRTVWFHVLKWNTFLYGSLVVLHMSSDVAGRDWVKSLFPVFQSSQNLGVKSWPLLAWLEQWLEQQCDTDSVSLQLVTVTSLCFFLAVFLTGSDRIPILGMKCLKLVIQPTGGGEDYLPVAHTCFNLLDLPKYTDKETLKSKLIQAIDHYEGFSLV